MRRIFLYPILFSVGCIENSLFWRSEKKVLEPTSEPTREPTQEPTADPSTEPESQPTNDPSYEPSIEPSQEPAFEPSAEPSNTPSSEPSSEEGTSPGSAIPPYPGELVINELMIDPENTQDKFGEWIEIYNRSTYWLDMHGVRIADNNKDDYEIQILTSGVIAPGDYFLICAEASSWDNGGVDCHATFLYKTLGGGFALSNSDDEVYLLSEEGYELDAFEYESNFASEGSSMGVVNGYETVTGNDSQNHWCEQWSFMSGGDSGSPGEENFCF